MAEDDNRSSYDVFVITEYLAYASNINDSINRQKRSAISVKTQLLVFHWATMSVPQGVVETSLEAIKTNYKHFDFIWPALLEASKWRHRTPPGLAAGTLLWWACLFHFHCAIQPLYDKIVSCCYHKIHTVLTSCMLKTCPCHPSGNEV